MFQVYQPNGSQPEGWGVKQTKAGINMLHFHTACELRCMQKLEIATVCCWSIAQPGQHQSLVSSVKQKENTIVNETKCYTWIQTVGHTSDFIIVTILPQLLFLCLSDSVPTFCSSWLPSWQLVVYFSVILFVYSGLGCFISARGSHLSCRCLN